MIKWIEEGGIVPRWYGIAWRDWHSYRSAILPIPLNVLAAWGRHLWYVVRFKLLPRSDVLLAAKREGWMEGYEQGCAQGDRCARTTSRQAFDDGYDTAVGLIDIPREQWAHHYHEARARWAA